MLGSLRNSILSIVYPQECRVCAQAIDNIRDGVACSACWEATHIFDGNEMLCSKCGAFFNAEGVQMEIFCHKCDDQHFEKARAVGIYEKGLAATALNFKREPKIPERLLAPIAEALRRYGFSKSSLIVPVPLSQKRRIERGYNQAEIIASLISSQTGIRLDTQSLIRSRHTPMHRVAMDKKARELTVQNAFEIARPKLIEGQTILLVDDILTSGATASACAKILKKNGADAVNVFTLARAVLH